MFDGQRKMKGKHVSFRNHRCICWGARTFADTMIIKLRCRIYTRPALNALITCTMHVAWNFQWGNLCCCVICALWYCHTHFVPIIAWTAVRKRQIYLKRDHKSSPILIKYNFIGGKAELQIRIFLTRPCTFRCDLGKTNPNKYKYRLKRKERIKVVRRYFIKWKLFFYQL